jgi:hypothetical protein
MNKADNVITLGEIKDKKAILEATKNYSRYLKSLSNAQLEEEINFLLKSISGKTIPQESFDRGRLIIKEISNRVDPISKQKIQKLSKSTLLN